MKDSGKKIILTLSILLAVLLGIVGGLYIAPVLEGRLLQKDKPDLQGQEPDMDFIGLPSDVLQKPEVAQPLNNTLKTLQGSLDLFFENHDFNEEDKWAVYVSDLSSGKTAQEFYQADEGEKMLAASLIKVFIAGAVYAEAEKNSGFTIADKRTAEIKTMLCDSDNNSANELIKVLGGGDYEKGFQKVNAFAEEIGCRSTRLNRRLLDQSAAEDNYTTVSDCAKALGLIADGSFVSKAVSEEIEDFLLADSKINANKDSKIRAGIYMVDTDKTAKVANKTGENFTPRSIENDIAIVTLDSGTRYIICIMSNTGNTAAAKEAIKELAGITHEYFLSEE